MPVPVYTFNKDISGLCSVCVCVCGWVCVCVCGWVCVGRGVAYETPVSVNCHLDPDLKCVCVYMCVRVCVFEAVA